MNNATVPVRNCSKFSSCVITGAALPNPAGLNLSFGIVPLGRRQWRMSGIEYQASVGSDTLMTGMGNVEDWSAWNGTVIVVRPANFSFLYDMFAGILNFAYAGNQYNPVPNNTIAFSSAADLKTLALQSVTPDIDTGRRFNRIITEAAQPGMIDSFFQPPLLHAFSFSRVVSNFAAASYATAMMGSQEWAKTDAQIEIPAGYDVLLTYVVPGGYSGAYMTTNISMVSCMRFKLEQA